jgi:hypothetical protein
VLQDSEHVACRLLALEPLYPPAYQLALDMLKRLHASAGSTQSPEQILEVLLLRHQLLPALRFLRSQRTLLARPPPGLAQRFLEPAAAQIEQPGGPALFYAVYAFFEQRKELNAPHLDPYRRLHQQLQRGQPSSRPPSPVPVSSPRA